MTMVVRMALAVALALATARIAVAADAADAAPLPQATIAIPAATAPAATAPVTDRAAAFDAGAAWAEFDELVRYGYGYFQRDGVDGPAHLAAAGDRVLHPVVGGVAGLLEEQEEGVREPLREHVAGGGVPDAAGPQLVDDLGDVVRRDPPAP